MNSNKSFPNVPWTTMGFGVDCNVGIIDANLGGKLIRVKGLADSAIRLENQSNSTIAISNGETDYFFIPEGESVEVVSGSVNVMY